MTLKIMEYSKRQLSVSLRAERSNLAFEAQIATNPSVLAMTDRLMLCKVYIGIRVLLSTLTK
jgi:hypothetical protein